MSSSKLNQHIKRISLLTFLLFLLKFETIFCLNSPSSSIRVNPNKINVEEGHSNQPISTAPHNHNRASSLLKYSNLSEEERKSNNGKEVDHRIGKWFEDHLPYFKPDFISIDGLGNSRRYRKNETSSNSKRVSQKEFDEEMPGSIITHFHETDDFLSGIEILPTADSMLDLIDPSSMSQSHEVPRRRSILTRMKHRCRRFQQHKAKEGEGVIPFFGSSQHNERMNLDIRRQSLCIASQIQNKEQWKEFFEDTQGKGLESILQCIRDCAKEIRLGYAADIMKENDEISMLHQERRRRNAFVAACSAVKILRDMCAIDQNWAAVITDEILDIDRMWCDEKKKKEMSNDSSEVGNGFFEDLAILLRYTNEAEHFYNLNIGSIKKRRKLRTYGITMKRFGSRKQRREAKKMCTLFVNQLLLGMALASDDAIDTFRSATGLLDSILLSSSYNSQQRLKGRWSRYPIEKAKRIRDSLLRKKAKSSTRPFLEAAKVSRGLKGRTQATSNKLLAAIGHNVFVPKVPGQRGLRILSLDGGGTRGIASIAIIRAIVEEMGGEVCDLFDIICGTSTGAIIAFLVGLRLESSAKARSRYDELIAKIFVKSSLSTPMLFLTTAAYSEVPFKQITQEILGDYSMIDSREDPRVPFVFAVSSKMSSSSNKLSLFRNYNYEGGEQHDKFIVNPVDARRRLGLKPIKSKNKSHLNSSTSKGSRHEGSFRVLQRAALIATTAAPTVFKPVVMGGEIYSDGGIVASNPAAVAIHEARTLFPDIPIELCVSCGTGEFDSKKVSPNFGWDGIINQIVKSATDTAKTHWVLEDILGQGHTCNGGLGVSNTKYFRFDPKIGDPGDFPIDGTNTESLEKLSRIATDYMKDNEQMEKLKEIKTILGGRRNPFAR